MLAIVKAIENWKTYLYGRKFIVYSDHQPLTWLVTKKNPHPRLERWNMLLSVYQFEIRYKKGADNIVADALSRIPYSKEQEPDEKDDYLDILIANISELEESCEGEGNETRISDSNSDNNAAIIANTPTSANERIYLSSIQEQQKDPDICWIIKLIKTHKNNKPSEIQTENNTQREFLKEYNNLRIIAGILYRSTENWTGYFHSQYVLPSQLVEKIIEKVHSAPFRGHLGQRKTLRILNERFYRPYLQKNILDYIRACDICQKIKVVGSEARTNLQPILPERTNQLVSTDFAGPFKESEAGNKYLIVIVDCFSKFLVSVPLPNKEAKTAAQALLNNWCWTFGLPERILSDLGGEYDSSIWDATCDLLDIERTHTTPYHPQADGQSEKAVQQIKRMIRAHVDESQNNWDQGIKQLCFSYNSSFTILLVSHHS